MLKENDIRKSVLEKIRSGEVPMRSRAYFALRTVLVVVMSLLMLAAALFALSFMSFSVHESGVRFLLEFGEHGLVAFVALFPWHLLLISLLILVILEFLLNRFTPAYRFPFLRTFLWILVALIAGSTLVGFTPLHSFLLSEADRNELPVLGPFYEQVHDSHQEQGVYRGSVSSVDASGFIIAHDDSDKDSDEGSWHIVPPPGFDLGTLSVGEKVYVGGRLQSGVVYAYGVHSLSGEE
ncbi:MAG: hypothetical protein KGH56_00340 [Patescibacteria group bacterium]|nr:hypothetical protein [Patescibacteria group bacterium]